MSVVLVYARLYADCLKKAGRGIVKNWWTLLLPIGLSYGFLLAAMLLGALLGRAVGFVLGFLLAAVFSAYLYFVAETVQNSKASLADFKKSMGAYFWSLINVSFMMWIFNLMFTYAIAGNPHSGTLRLALNFLVLVLLNAVPEIIYQRGTYGFGAVIESIKFIQENWIEWLVPHLLLGGAIYLASPTLFDLLTAGPAGALSLYVLSLPLAIAGGVLLHVLMVFRGHLFDALNSSSHRQRMFKFRTPS